jgi:hypothetical protein
MTQTPAPTNYSLIGPPDLLHDLILDFEEIGWRCTVFRWQAVISSPEGDPAHTAPLWPAEITLARVTTIDHEDACHAHFGVPGS